MKIKYFQFLSAIFIVCIIIIKSNGVSAQTQLNGFKLTGDPESSNGATWTFKDTINSIFYDLSGILYKPAGTGIFPAIIISHGAYDNSSGDPKKLAKIMVKWGLVCIAVNYSYATGVPVGSPGTSDEYGATYVNILRAHKCRDILASLVYVDTLKVAAHGYSNGAFITGALAGLYPAQFKVVSHSGGGAGNEFYLTKFEHVKHITAPYQMHHGDADDIISISLEQKFDSLLSLINIPHQLCIYPGYNHFGVRTDTTMLRRIRTWYSQYGLLPLTQIQKGQGSTVPLKFNLEQNYPNPFNPVTSITYNLPVDSYVRLKIYNILGGEEAALINKEQNAGSYKIDFTTGKLGSGIYFCRIQTEALESHIGSFSQSRKMVFLK